MSLPLDESVPIKSGAISKRKFFEPIFMRTFYIGVLAPLIFARLGSSNVFAPYLEQSQWLVSKLAVIWPALPVQYEQVLSIRGPGHAASFAFLSAALWTWPIICAAAFFRQEAKYRTKTLPVSELEIVQFLVLFLGACGALLIDQIKLEHSLFAFAFHADAWGFFYLRQWFLFSCLSMVLAIAIYFAGHVVMSWFGRRTVQTAEK